MSAADPARDSTTLPDGLSGKPANQNEGELLWLPIAKLKPWKDNPRKNDGEPVTKVADSIKRFGFSAPIVARRENYEIIAGHTRWKAAQKLGLATVPVRLLDIDEKNAHLLAVADNRLTELTLWDDAPLKSVLDRYDAADQLLAGWSEKDIRELERRAKGDAELEDDEVPELPTDPITKVGDLWLLGKHRLVCGDSTNADVSKQAVGDLKPFIMVTDPPYGVNYEPEWRMHSRGPDGKPLSKGDHGKRMGKVLNDDNASWLPAWNLFDGDVSYVWCDSINSPLVAGELDESGVERRALIIWRKPRIIISRGHYHWQHEVCWYGVRGGRTARWCGDRSQSTVWDIALKEAASEQTEHSTQKPLECMGRPMRNHGNAGDVVYEPFCGSGTTLIAAQHLERVCCAIELNPAYCDVIVERWQNLTGEKAERRAV